MSETAVTAPQKRDPSAPKRSIGVTLVGSKGKQLRFQANLQKDGSAKSSALFTVRSADGKVVKDQTKRGVSEAHANMEAAVAAINRHAEKAVKAGYARKVVVRKADAFGIDNLPSPR